MFNTAEINLMVIYNPGSRLGLARALGCMLGSLSGDEIELRALTMGVLKKLERMTDGEFAALDLSPYRLLQKGR